VGLYVDEVWTGDWKQKIYENAVTEVPAAVQYPLHLSGEAAEYEAYDVHFLFLDMFEFLPGANRCFWSSLEALDQVWVNTTPQSFYAYILRFEICIYNIIPRHILKSM
jgi:hypothetical protein